jgi:uncharacterized protein (TIGR03382 family)
MRLVSEFTDPPTLIAAVAVAALVALFRRTAEIARAWLR